MSPTELNERQAEIRTHEEGLRQVSEALAVLVEERARLRGLVALKEEDPARLLDLDVRIAAAEAEEDDHRHVLPLLRSRLDNDLEEDRAAHLDAIRGEDHTLYEADRKGVRRLSVLLGQLADLDAARATREARRRDIAAELSAATPEKAAEVRAAYEAEVAQVEGQFGADLQEADREAARAIRDIHASHPFDNPDDFLVGTDVEVTERGKSVALVKAPSNASRAIGVVSSWRVSRWEEIEQDRRSALTRAATRWAAASREAGLGTPDIPDPDRDRVLDSHRVTWVGIRPPALRDVFVGIGDHHPDNPGQRHRHDPVRWGLAQRRLRAERDLLTRLGA